MLDRKIGSFRHDHNSSIFSLHDQDGKGLLVIWGDGSGVFDPHGSPKVLYKGSITGFRLTGSRPPFRVYLEGRNENGGVRLMELGFTEDRTSGQKWVGAVNELYRTDTASAE